MKTGREKHSVTPCFKAQELKRVYRTAHSITGPSKATAHLPSKDPAQQSGPEQAQAAADLQFTMNCPVVSTD